MSDDTATIEPPITRTRTDTRTRVKPNIKRPVPWHVVLHDDNHHSYPYVMDMMTRLFRKPVEEAFLMAQIVDRSGQVICETTHKERAEFKRDQILGFGADPFIQACKGSMTATIEPATAGGGGGGGDDNDRGQARD